MEFSKNHQKHKISVTYLADYENILDVISVLQCLLSELIILTKKIPKGVDPGITNYPALIIVNLAVGKNLRYRGLEPIILKHCIGMGKFLLRRIGCRYVILYAIEALTFYSRDKSPYRFFISKHQESNDFKQMYYPLFSNDFTTQN